MEMEITFFKEKRLGQKRNAPLEETGKGKPERQRRVWESCQSKRKEMEELDAADTETIGQKI